MTDHNELVEKVAKSMHNTWRRINGVLEDTLPYEDLDKSEQVDLRMEARAAIAVVLEEAAKVCISVSTDALTKVGREHEPYMRATAEDCAAAIRAMKDKQ